MRRPGNVSVQLAVIGHYSQPNLKKQTDNELGNILTHVRQRSYHNIVVVGDLNRRPEETSDLCRSLNLIPSLQNLDSEIKTWECLRGGVHHSSRTDYVLSTAATATQFALKPHQDLRLDHNYLFTSLLVPTSPPSMQPKESCRRVRYVPYAHLDLESLKATLLSAAWPRRPLNLLLYKAGQAEKIDLSKIKKSKLLSLKNTVTDPPSLEELTSDRVILTAEDPS